MKYDEESMRRRALIWDRTIVFICGASIGWAIAKLLSYVIEASS